MKTPLRLIVLHYTKYGDKSIVLHTLSAQYGRRSFMVKLGTKTPVSLFLPMNILDCTTSSRNKSWLWFASGFSCPYPLNSIRTSIHKNSITLFLSEVLWKVLREEVPDPEIYEWCEKAVVTLDSLQGSYSNFHVLFLLELCSVMGFAPDPEGLAPFVGDNLQACASLLGDDLPTSFALPLSGAVRNQICEGILMYLEHHSESPIKVNSLKILREIFQ